MNVASKIATPSTTVRSARRLSAVILFISLTLVGCATSPTNHKYIMKGQVLAVDQKQLVVCIGESDGAAIGQVLNVVRHVPIMIPKATLPTFRRENVGTVQIVSVFDQHYAKAEISVGNPRVGDTVELDRK